MKPQSLIARISSRAAAEPDLEAFTFLADGEGDERRLTYGELDRRARAIAGRLAAGGGAGSRALLLFPPGLDYVTAFLGCLYAGVVAVPAYPPTGSRGVPRLQAILADCEPGCVLTVAALRVTVERLLTRRSEIGDLPVLAVDEIAGPPETDEAPLGSPDLRIDSRSLAFLQYTSGTTSIPKGVMVSHGNLLANQAMIQEAFATEASSTVVSWLPLYHDMGLIGGLLHPLYLGARCILLSPIHFLQRPGRWLRAISRYRASVSGGPNFAYDLCARKITPAEAEGLDLGSWRVAFNGAEPVRAAALASFAAAFAGAGFRRTAFFPCYGLAEATLLVSGGRSGEEVAVVAAEAEALARDRVEEPAPGGRVRRIVSCGQVPAGLDVRLVDPVSSTACPAGTVGEIWVAGESVAGGYWRRPEESAATFGARLAGGSEPFLRTGDLGFLREGELFVGGRIKELIVIRGRNLYPQDVESTVARCHPALRPGGGAAFAIDAIETSEGERLAVVQEVDPRAGAAWEEVAETIRREVAEEHEVQVSSLVLVKPGAVPKTTSGKIQRRACRDLFLAGGLAALGEWSEGSAGGGERPAPRTEAEERVRRIWAEVLGLPPDQVGVEDSFFATGGDSLRGIQLLARLADETGVEITLDELFEAPTVLQLAARIASSGTPAEPVERRPIECGDGRGRGDQGEPRPLSSPQRRLWFLDQMEPGNPAYNLAFAVRLEGELDPAFLAAALTEIVRRHDALRTVFRVIDDAPAQVVLAPSQSAPPLPLVDLSGLPAPAGAAAAASAVERQVGRLAFDLARGPLLRAFLVRLAGREHELQLAIHHIVSDAWSIGVFLRELAVLYAAFAAGRPSPLSELPIQYADYAAFEERRRSQPAVASQLAAWRERLGGRLPVLSLPADRPRPPVQSYRGAHAVHFLSPRTREALEAVATRQGASLFMGLVAGFQALLARLTAQEDLITGTAIANRDRVALEGLIGFFVNTLALRTDLAGDPPFAELLARVRSTVLAAFSGREVPFERLVDELRPERDLSHTPIVQVMLVLQSAPLDTAAPIPGLSLAAREIDNGTARFDLALSLVPAGGGLQAVFKYSRDLFDATTMDRLAGQLERLLAGAAAEPGRRLASLPLLSLAERHQVTGEWNATAAEYRLGACLHELIEAQVDRTPGEVALAFEGRELTYRDLDLRANQLAHRLRRLGVGPEVLVGVAIERSLDLMVGLLGVLKAGGAYLPLDPSYPQERLAFMVEDARVPVLLTQARLRGEIPAGTAHVLCLDSEWEGIAAESVARPAVPVLPENPAYVIYTSGSTGRPKGSVIPHRGIVNRLLWMQEAYGLTLGEGVLQKTPVSFDVSVWELFWPLLVGARLVLARPGGHQDSAYLAGLIAAERVTTLHFVPSMLQVFLEEPRLADCAGLKRVMVSGEALPRDLSQRFFARFGKSGPGLHNLYGPTEASVDVTSWACERESGGTASGVPIGRPIANLRIHLLDRGGSPVPVGVPGHLHIGGVGLARGYLRRPELTAERFVPDPVGEPGGRLYATGDLARLRPDGAIEFLGRLDHQVKIRGFRIELGEIEAGLNAHPAVRESVVVARGDDGRKRLVAYLVGDGAARPQADELRSWLLARLPEHMVPASFVVLPAFPLNPSGKVDRGALPAAAEEPADEGVWTAPRTPLESRLATMWSEQLGVSRVGVDDSFFALGGDSIQGALFINRLQRELGAIVYVMALFDHPTVAELAAHLTAAYRSALVEKGWLAATAGEGEEETAIPDEEAEAADRAELARYLRGRFSPPAQEAGVPVDRNRPAIFLLSPFRSGSTLLRVMLAGHPRLFAPPELELLGFADLGERRRTFSGRDSFSREGLLRAVMELQGGDAESATALLAEAEDAAVSTPAFYARLQQWAGDRILVDKTPRYALDLPTLERAESWFTEPLYIHLVRHPAAVIHSYLEAKLDQVYRFPLPPRRQAELVWRVSHENILDFLATVPGGRRHTLRFEDLVRAPRGTIEELCSFLGLDFHPAMLSPYQGERMTDGIRREGRMMGDPKFHQHRRIEAEVADRWRSAPGQAGFGAATWRLAERLGYPPPAPLAASEMGPRPLPARAAETAGTSEIPFSFGQQRLWFLDRLEPGSSAYNMPAAVRLSGRLDVPALARALSEIERRHEVLRTIFPAAGGRPRPIVREPRAALLKRVDLAGLLAPAREREAGRWIEREAHFSFDLEAGPLWRTLLLDLVGEEHLLLVNLHHVVCDGWSVGVLTGELAALYGAFRDGRPSPLPEPALQYADFAAWQREHLSGEVLADHLRYFRESLAAPLPVLELPTDRPRPAVQTHRGERLALQVRPALTAGLRELGAGAQATLFMVLVGAFKALLGRYTGEEDLLIGTPVANRNRAEIEGLIGPFVNTLVLRTDLSLDPGFRALLGRVRQVCLGAARHEELPFEKLVEELGVERSLGSSPLFSVMLALQNAPQEALALPGLTLERLEVATRTAKFDLTLDLAERRGEGGLGGTIEYNADLFDVATVARLAGHFVALLTSVLAAPDCRLSTLPLLSASERHELVVTTNDTAVPLASRGVVHELFEAAARRAPEAVAVGCEGQRLRYADLAERSERLAHFLTRLGVGPEVRVGIYLERSPEMVVALLAVLRSGGAYVPLDPAYPQERVGYILGDSGAAVVLTDRALAAALPPLDARVVVLGEETDWEAVAPPSSPTFPPSPSRRSGPENLAYVIYTSGSTGHPKGVELGHLGVVNYLESMARRPGLAAGDVMMAVTTLSFDIAVTELLLPLGVGARIELVTRETAGDASRLARVIDAAGATAMQATPATWTLLLDGGWQGRAGMKALCGGEALPPALAARLLPRVGSLWNVYGPTETTVWSTLAEIVPGARVSIGEPLANTSVHLLDRHGHLAPRGVPGELAIGGLGLARGYHQRPALTAERFIPDPWGGAGARLYRTGDLARRLPGGELDCLGRLDHQVKVRGFRIELGEIESVLREHPAVRQCAVVLAKGERPADQRLVAYVVRAASGGESELSWEGLRGFLRQRLPLPMVPTAVVFLDRLPLLPSGKVDRKGLPDPGRERPDLAASYVSPHNERERLIAEVWHEVLGLERVGIHDNFFDLGGHSLLAAEVHGKLRERLGLDLPLLDLFRYPTVHALAGRLRAEEPEAPPKANLQQVVAGEREALLRRRRALAQKRGAP